jgi:hypothetical protein
MRLCKYCKFYQREDGYIPPKRGFWISLSPGLAVHDMRCRNVSPPRDLCTAIINPVDGNPKWSDCGDLRHEYGRCGPTGKLWKAK